MFKAVLLVALVAAASVAAFNPAQNLGGIAERLDQNKLNAVQQAAQEVNDRHNLRGEPVRAVKNAPAVEGQTDGAPLRPAIRFRRIGRAIRRVVRGVGRAIGGVVRRITAPIRKVVDGVKFLVKGHNECITLGGKAEEPFPPRVICIKVKAKGISGKVSVTATDRNTGISSSASGKNAKQLSEKTVTEVVDKLSKECHLDFSAIGLVCKKGVGPVPPGM